MRATRDPAREPLAPSPRDHARSARDADERHDRRRLDQARTSAPRRRLSLRHVSWCGAARVVESAREDEDTRPSSDRRHHFRGAFMIKWLKELDRILRGDATRLQTLRKGTIDVRARGLTIVILLLGMFYGLCMGTFAVISGRAGTYQQMLASMAKVPALFLLTLLVTFPSL